MGLMRFILGQESVVEGWAIGNNLCMLGCVQLHLSHFKLYIDINVVFYICFATSYKSD